MIKMAEEFILMPGMTQQFEDLELLDKLFEKKKEEFLENIDYYYQYWFVKYNKILRKEYRKCQSIQSERSNDPNHPIHKANPESLGVCFKPGSIENQDANLFNYLISGFYDSVKGKKIIVNDESFYYGTYKDIYRLSKPFLKYFSDKSLEIKFIGEPKISIPNLVAIPKDGKMTLFSLAVLNPIIQMYLENIAEVKLIDKSQQYPYNFIIQEDNEDMVLIKDKGYKNSIQSIIVCNDLRLHQFLIGVGNRLSQNSRNLQEKLEVCYG